MKKIFTIGLLFLYATTFSQKIINKKGDFKILRDQTEVEVKFDYSDLKLFKDNYTETEYIEKRKEELNQKEDGKGDIWEKKWLNSKSAIWEPKFLESLLKTATKKSKIAFKDNAPNSKYIMLVEVVWIYPGWDVFMMKQHAKVTTHLKLIERENPTNILMEFDAKEAPGDQFGNQFSNETRIGEGFAKTAKTVGKMILKSL